MQSESSELHFLLDNPHFVRWVREPDAGTQAYWEEWLNRHPDKRTLVEEARHIVLFLHMEEEAPSEREFLDVKAKIRAQIRPEPVKPGARVLNSLSRYIQVAAVLIAVLLAGLAFYQYRPAVAMQPVVYASGYGQLREVHLPDQSVVTLNANSSLRYTPDWSAGKPREVWLSGEGFFRVKKQRNPQTASFAKFVVHTRSADVVVRGTEFNVHDRHDKVTIVLESGKVDLALKDTLRPLIRMKPGELVEVFGKGRRPVMHKKVQTTQYTTWLQRKLVFEEAPLAEIAQVMNDYYGVKVEFGDKKLAVQKFTGSVPNANLDVLLTVLAESFDLRITRRDSTIRIKSRR